MKCVIDPTYITCASGAKQTIHCHAKQIHISIISIGGMKVIILLQITTIPHKIKASVAQRFSADRSFRWARITGMPVSIERETLFRASTSSLHDAKFWRTPY